MTFNPNNLPEFGPRKSQRKSQDSKNMMVFIAVVLALLFVFDAYVMQPKIKRLEAIEAAKNASVLTSNQGRAAFENGAGQNNTILSLPDALAKDARLALKNDHISGSINLTGGRIDDLYFEDYFETLAKENRVHLLEPSSTKSPYYVEYGWIPQDSKIATPNSKSQWQIKPGTPSILTPQSPVTLIWDNGQNVIFERQISLDEDFLFSIRQNVINQSDATIRLHPFSLISRHGIPDDLQNAWVLHEGPIAYFNKELHQKTYKNLLKKKNEVQQSADNGWAGITDKYWMVTLIPDQNDQKTYRFIQNPAPTSHPGLTPTPRFQVDVLGTQYTAGPGETISYDSRLFAGAKKVGLIEKYESQYGIPHFDLTVDFGWFYFITKPFFHAIKFFFDLTGNFGVAIVLFTFVLRLFVFPLANTSYKSFAKMKKISPQILELRENCKDDRARMQQELVKLYQKEKVNPLAGCFPILIQIPIFFSLYKVLFITLEMRHAPFFGWVQDLSAADPTSILNLFGLLPYDAPSFLQIGIWPCLMLITMVIQQRLSPPPPDPIQRRMMLLFPFFLTYIMAQFPAGLVVYWTVSAMLAIIQQYVIMRRMNVPVHLFTRSKEEEKIDDMVASGQSAHPQAQMVVDMVDDAMVQDHEDGENTSPPKKVSKPKPKKSKKR